MTDDGGNVKFIKGLIWFVLFTLMWNTIGIYIFVFDAVFGLNRNRIHDGTYILFILRN